MPVRLAITNPPTDIALTAGMSAVVSVDTGRRRNLLAGLTP